MRQVAIFNKTVQEADDAMPYMMPLTQQSFTLNYIPVPCGLIQVGDTQFDPSKPENREKVLIRKKAFSCNYRDKSLILTAKQAIDQFDEKNQAKFFALGSEFAGEGVALGGGVESLEIGDRVIGNGSYPYSGFDNARPGLPTNRGSKELEIFHFAKVIKIPASMPIEIAASFPIGGQTVYSMIRKLDLQQGQKVLVTAATSNTSLFAIQALKHLPVEVYAVTTRADYNKELYEMGVEKVFVVEKGLPSLIKDPVISEFVGANGLFDAVIDPFFDIYLHQTVHLIQIGGKYVTCGMHHQPYLDSTGDAVNLSDIYSKVMTMVMIKNINIIGNCIGESADLDRALEDYDAGKLDVVVDSVYREGEISEFFERSFNATDRFGKVVYAY